MPVFQPDSRPREQHDHQGEDAAQHGLEHAIDQQRRNRYRAGEVQHGEGERGHEQQGGAVVSADQNLGAELA